jgi:hypothetical protein
MEMENEPAVLDCNPHIADQRITERTHVTLGWQG